MPRPCGPCGSKVRNELDRRLLEMEISHESYRTISHDFGYSVDALKRHKAKHLVIDLSEIKQVMEEARVEALEEVKARELEELKAKASKGMAARLDNAESYLDKLNVALHEAADLLDKAKKANDLRAAGVFLGKLTDQLKIMAELAGKLPAPQVNILIDPEWVELRTRIVMALEPYPEAKLAVADALET
jgi:hypothetical protein